MARSRKVLIAAVALGTAAAIGFVMQMTPGPVAALPPEALPTGGVAEAQPLAGVTLVTPEPAARIELSGITLTSSRPEASGADTRPLSAPGSAPAMPALSDSPDALPGAKLAQAADASASADGTPAMPADPAAAGPLSADACPITLTAEPAAAALVTLSFHAKCAPYTRVVFSHEGMSFGEMTDSDGRIDIAAPALAENARFVATLPTGEGTEAAARVESLAFYDRAVLMSSGLTGMTLHALEDGAGYDDIGHIWAGAPRDPSVAARGEGGFMLMLGDPTLSEAQLAQVYSFPTGMIRGGGDVSLSLEAEVLRSTCEREVTATIVQLKAGARVNERDVSLTMPGCDAVGDFLLLKTPLLDLKIASR